MGRKNDRQRAHRLAHQWPWVAARGAIGLALAGLAILWPLLTDAMPVAPFVAFAMIDGLLAVVMGLRRRTGLPRFGSRSFMEGVASLAFAGMALAFSSRELFLLMAAQALTAGLLRILILVRWHNAITGDGVAVLSGLTLMLFGLIFVIAQRANALLLSLIFAAYLISYGILMLELARRWRLSLSAAHAQTTA